MNYIQKFIRNVLINKHIYNFFKYKNRNILYIHLLIINSFISIYLIF